MNAVILAIFVAVISLVLEGCNLWEGGRQLAPTLQAEVQRLERAGPVVKKGQGRGIVLVGGSTHHVANSTRSYTVDALLSIAALRRAGSRLPVELWHDGDRTLTQAELPEGVRLRDIRDVLGDAPFKTNQLPYIAMMHSGFEELLYMDSDNVVIEDPAALFDIAAYTTHGVIFWPGFRSFNRGHLIWSVTSKQYFPAQEVENGQLLIHKDRHWKQLELQYYFSKQADSHADKNLLMMAFLALSTPFYQVETPAGSLGYATKSGAFCGHTMLQYHPSSNHSAQPVFAHRNLQKWSAYSGTISPTWLAIKPGRSTILSPGEEPVVPHEKQSPECKCDGGHCVDLDTTVDNSSSTQELLRTLKAIEVDLIQLHTELTGDGRGLKPQWWVPWKVFLAKHSRSGKSMSGFAAGSSAASWLAAYLSTCVESIPRKELEFATLDNGGSETWAEHPHSNSGKYIRCLAEHPQLTRIAVLFYGYAGPNGVFCASLGLRAKGASEISKVFTAEADPKRCSQGKLYLSNQGMSDYVDLYCGILCENLNEDACYSYMKQKVCPEAPLDFLSIDFALGVPPMIYRSILKACTPEVLFVENSGMDISELPGVDDESHSNFSEHSADSWHHWEDEVLHAQSVHGLATELGSFRVAVDRHLSRFDAELVKWHWTEALGFSRQPSAEKPRWFSVYISSDSRIGKPSWKHEMRHDEL